MTDHDPAPWNPAEPERAGWTAERKGRPKFYMPALSPAKPRDFQAEMAEETERKAQKRQAKDKPVFEGSRQMAERLDSEMTEQKENEG